MKALTLLKDKKNLSDFKFFLYYVQEHELEATLNAAYKLYKERGKFFSDRWYKVKKRDYLNCLIYLILNTYGIKKKTLLYSKISVAEILDALNTFDEYKACLFVILWIMYCYMPKKSKFYNLLFKQQDLEIPFDFNVQVIENNKDNIVDFFSSLNYYEIEYLNKKIPITKLGEVFKQVFSITQDNWHIFENLQEMLPEN